MPVPIFGRSSIGTLSLMHSFWAEGNGTHTGGQVSSSRSASGGKDKSMYYNLKQSGARIREKRKERGYKQEQLAEQLDISANHLANIEAGRKGLSVELLVELADNLDVSLDYLILGKETRTAGLRNKVHSFIEFLIAFEKTL